MHKDRGCMLLWSQEHGSSVLPSTVLGIKKKMLCWMNEWMREWTNEWSLLCCQTTLSKFSSSQSKMHIVKNNETREGKYLDFSPNPETTYLWKFSLIPHSFYLLMFWGDPNSSLSRFKTGLQRFRGAKDSQLVCNRAGICSWGSLPQPKVYPPLSPNHKEGFLTKGTND